MEFFQRLADGFKNMWNKLSEGFSNFSFSGMFGTGGGAGSGPGSDPVVRATPAPIEERYIPPVPAAPAPAQETVAYGGPPLTESFRSASGCRADFPRPGLMTCSMSGYPSGYVPDLRGQFSMSAHRPDPQELAIQRSLQRGLDRAVYQATTNFLSGYRSPFR